MTGHHLTYSSVLVLQSISRGYSYGFDIMDATGLPSGTVYPALRRLESLRYVTAKWESSGVAQREKRPRRRYYETSSAGEAALSKALERFHALVEPLPESERHPTGERELS
jgi:DNA-binding PadR family transcriptional regulator